MVHPFLDLEGEGADLWKVVANFMDGRTLVRLSLANRGWGEFILQDNLLWKNACFMFLGLALLDHSVVHLNWREIYGNLCKVRDGNPILLGGISVEETSLIVTAQLDINGLNALREKGEGPIGFLFTNVRKGVWVVNQFCERCVDLDCGRSEIALEACVVDHYMTEDYLHNHLDWYELNVENVRNKSVECGFFVPTRLNDPSSVEVAKPNLWGWGNMWEITSKRAPYAVGSTQRTPNFQEKGAHIEVKDVDDEVLAVRILSFLPAHDHEG